MISVADIPPTRANSAAQAGFLFMLTNRYGGPRLGLESPLFNRYSIRFERYTYSDVSWQELCQRLKEWDDSDIRRDITCRRNVAQDSEQNTQAVLPFLQYHLRLVRPHLFFAWGHKSRCTGTA